MCYKISKSLQRIVSYTIRPLSTKYSLNEELVVDLSHRISHLERRVQLLQQNQEHLSSLKTILQMAETFRSLHRLISKQANVRGVEEGLTTPPVRKLLKKYRLTPKEMEQTLEICQARNEVAHPSDVPDLTEVSSDVTKIYTKVERLLKDLQRQ